MKIRFDEHLVPGNSTAGYNCRIPPATESEVASFEQLIGFALPQDYRDFLLTINGGVIDSRKFEGVICNVSPVPETTKSVAYGDPEAIDMGYMLTLYEGIGDLLNMRSGNLFSLTYSYKFYSTMEDENYRFVPPYCIPIASVHDSGFIILALDGPYKGKVLYFGYQYFDTAQFPYENARLIADSFTEFENSLYES